MWKVLDGAFWFKVHCQELTPLLLRVSEGDVKRHNYFLLHFILMGSLSHVSKCKTDAASIEIVCKALSLNLHVLEWSVVTNV